MSQPMHRLSKCSFFLSILCFKVLIFSYILSWIINFHKDGLILLHAWSVAVFRLYELISAFLDPMEINFKKFSQTIFWQNFFNVWYHSRYVRITVAHHDLQKLQSAAFGKLRWITLILAGFWHIDCDTNYQTW
jgi:hypothetical protein